MGADGHITIFDYNKVAKELSESEIDSLTSSTVYVQKLGDKKFITSYYGDNLYFTGDDWEDRFGSFGEEYKDKDWYLTKEEFDRRWDIVRKYRITSWEIWT